MLYYLNEKLHKSHMFETQINMRNVHDSSIKSNQFQLGLFSDVFVYKLLFIT